MSLTAFDSFYKYDTYNLLYNIFSKLFSFEQIMSKAVADPEGGFRGINPPPLQRLFFVFFCLSVYESSHGPGP